MLSVLLREFNFEPSDNEEENIKREFGNVKNEFRGMLAATYRPDPSIILKVSALSS